MPSQRRIRLLALAAIVTVAFFLFYSSRVDPGPDAHKIQDFYHKTMDGMKNASPPGQAIINTKTGEKAGHIPADKDADGDVDEDDRKATAQMQQRLKQAEKDAKDKANMKGGLKPDVPSEIVGKGNSAGGQPKKDDSAAADKALAEEPAEAAAQTGAEAELSSILKRAPVVIFSKTYCPYSKIAKGILLDKYHVDPAPFVVELDNHAQGPSLQDALLQMTGRRTVPNVLVNGVSIGGSDDVVELDRQSKLADKIRKLGNERVHVSERFAPAEGKL
ncbi:glutaredoxin domain-containing protein [Metarhizium album ARSEF 1941]|uniref:Glutaredoxin domain-containing protein n=1 Tax=Metarhizium album (strain ARSEF 1941) TaxID=1081103 RepID=A0A0B2WN74_METAS|nr:glutaredoxin domain-containing protein [Metarhizium album ARSEF 1941]KHN94460.1 glutaredoxin domain-containing protein [Metarhizium album ARSEF 1941]